MEPQVNRDSVQTSPMAPPPGQVRVVEQTAVQAAPTYDAAPVTEIPVEQRPTHVAPVAPVHAVERVESYTSIAAHAVAAGLLAVAMLVWGGVAVARAGLDDGLREPVVDALGLSGNALSGIIVGGIGVALLLAAIGRERGPIVFVSVIAGVAALIVAIEPDVGDGALGLESNVPVLIAAGCAVVLLIALVVPTMTRRSATIERV